ncbi:MAG: ParB N-terminal domain-containing protein [Bacteroidales bacterium]|nr:ParB N-terminal domain-containing protein [Bacteroidales bacterium]
MEQKTIKIADLEVNRGQIDGLPKNPRTIKDTRFEALKKSIEDAPEMLALRELLVYPHNGKFVVIGGNMRLKACKELGYKELPCKVIDENTPVEKLREYTIKDNIGFGSDDWGALFDDWNTDELADWGLEFPEDINVDETQETEIVEDEVPEEVETKCKRGDLWQLGEHRLMCGDATIMDDAEKLMGGGGAD